MVNIFNGKNGKKKIMYTIKMIKHFIPEIAVSNNCFVLFCKLI